MCYVLCIMYYDDDGDVWSTMYSDFNDDDGDV